MRLQSHMTDICKEKRQEKGTDVKIQEETF